MSMSRLGGWEINQEIQAANLPENVDTAFKEAVDGMVGIKYTPILFLGQQIVR